MSGHVKVGGTWKNVENSSVKVGGSWKNVTDAWTKVGGVWKKWYESGLKWSPVNIDNTRTFSQQGVFYTGNTYAINESVSGGWYSVDSSSWTVTDTSTQTYLGIVKQLRKGQDNVICFVADANTATKVYRSVNGMATNATGVVTTGINNTVLATNGSGTWVTAHNNDTRTSTNNGSSWTTRLDRFGALTVSALIYSPSASLWAAFFANSTSYYTSSDAITWTLRTLPFTFNSFSPVSYDPVVSGLNYVFATTTALDVWRSSNLIDWENTNRPALTINENYIRMAAKGSNIVFVGREEIANSTFETIYSTDSGTTWQSLPFDDGPIHYGDSLTFSGWNVIASDANEFLLIIGLATPSTRKFKVQL